MLTFVIFRVFVQDPSELSILQEDTSSEVSVPKNCNPALFSGLVIVPKIEKYFFLENEMYGNLCDTITSIEFSPQITNQSFLTGSRHRS